MRATSLGTRKLRTAIALMLASSLVVAALSAALPTLSPNVVALDDDDDDDKNKGQGNDDGAVDEDNSGKSKQDKKDKKDKDDESDFVTAVPTQTPEQQTEPTRTPVSSPTPVVLTPVAAGTLLIHLRVCPDGIDPAIGTAALRDACPDGRAGAGFELAGRSGLFDGWRRDVTTGAGGDARVTELAEGTYSLTLDKLDWCAAEASSVADGLLVIDPGETTEVTAYLCDDSGTPTAGS